ncbi:VOC family protein [Pseudomonas sp. Pseu.R1]|uniref:VOC family protein n=1 Tax=Pseudomonas sp. Pseu.R1 TaxID=3379818 RepID=UPI003B9404CC
MSEALTRGIHHLGLAVPDLEATTAFFCSALGWKEVGRKPEYPAAFVSDGSVTLTLWQVAEPTRAVAFDRRKNVGLHHLALAVPTHVALQDLFERVRDYPGVVVEFEPQPMRPGSDVLHFICAIPGGVRVEFATRAI